MKPQAALFVVVVAFSVLLQLVFLVGIKDRDSARYAEIAIHLERGAVEFEHPSLYTTRPLMTYPARISFRQFGVNEISAAVYPMLSSAVLLTLVYIVGATLYSHNVALVAILLLSVCPSFTLSSSTLMPDVPLTMFMTASVLCFFIAVRSPTRRQWFLFLSAGLLFGAAWLVKEMAITLLVFYGVYFLLRRNEITRSYWLLPLGGILIVVGEFAYYGGQTGDPFFRLHASVIGSDDTNLIENISTDISIAHGAPLFTDHRTSLLYSPYQMFVSINEYGASILLLTVALVYAAIRRVRELGICAIWFFSIFLYLEYGTWSLTHWQIGPHNPRYYIPALVPACLITAYWLVNAILPWRRSAFALLLIVALTTSFGMSCASYAIDVRVRNGSKWASHWLKLNERAQVYTLAFNMPPIMRFYATDSVGKVDQLPSHIDLYYRKQDFEDPQGIDYYKDVYQSPSEVPRFYVVSDEAASANDWDRPVIASEVDAPPSHWQLLATHQNETAGVAGHVLRLASRCLSILPSLPPRNRLQNGIDALASGSRTKIYFVDKSRRDSD